MPQYPGARVQTTGRFEVEDFAIQIQIGGLLSYVPSVTRPGRHLEATILNLSHFRRKKPFIDPEEVLIMSELQGKAGRLGCERG